MTLPDQNDLRIAIRYKVNDAFQYGEASESPNVNLINAALDLVVDEIMTKVQAEILAARIDESKQYKLKLTKHFTSWGGKQGNCMPEDVIDDRLKELEESK